MAVYQIELKNSKNFEAAYLWCIQNIGISLLINNSDIVLLSDFARLGPDVIAWDFDSKSRIITIEEADKSNRFVTTFYINSPEHATQFALMGF